MKKISLKIEGMHCEACSNRLTKVIISLDGVISAFVNLEDKNAEIQIEEEKITIDEIKEAISDAGFEAMEE